jgi:tRNA (guanine6-N2)-methyltransferase
MSEMKLLVTCDTGFEKVLAEELSEIAEAKILSVSSGRVFIEVPPTRLADVFRSRIANNIYVLIHVDDGVQSLDDIYRIVKGIDFTALIEPHQSFAIRPERIGTHSFTSIDIGRVAGQAVIDSYMQAKGVRLRVNLDEPDVEIYVELNEARLIVALSLTRTSLHMRGYKIFAHPAALKNTIASAMLRIAGWRPGEPLYDPMCGGGTIVIEAALQQKGIEVPCIARKNIDLAMLAKIHLQAVDDINRLCSRGVGEGERIHVGVDLNPRFVEGAAINAKSAGVDDATIFIVADSTEFTPRLRELEVEFGASITKSVFNPPYGYRMKPGAIGRLYRKMLSVLKESGFDVAVFITSAIRATEAVLREFQGVEVERLRVIHGTLPSYVYRVRFVK